MPIEIASADGGTSRAHAKCVEGNCLLLGHEAFH